MNKVELSGHICADPDIRYTDGSNGKEPSCIARYRLAVNRNKDQADFINCVAFGKCGEFAEKYFHKGDKIIIVGHIQTGSYKNKDGMTVYTTDVVVENQEFGGSKSDKGEKSDAPGEFDKVNDEELPFI